MRNTCGHCNYQGDLKDKNIFCLLLNTWNPIAFSCEHWVDYSPNMNREERVSLAIQARSSLESKESTYEQKKFQIWILILGVILGVAGTILTQWILNKLGLT
jgi:hypothetical protein